MDSNGVSLQIFCTQNLLSSIQATHSEVSISCGILQKATKQRRIVEIELLATVGWKWGCQPFSCPCSQNVTHCRTEVYATCLSRNPFLPFLFGMPSIQNCSVQYSDRVQALDYIQDVDCALSDMWLLQTNEQLSRFSFPQQCVGSGAASLSAARVRKMWRNAERDLFDMFCFRNPFPLDIYFCKDIQLMKTSESR